MTSKEVGNSYKWNTSDVDKSLDGGAPYSIVHLLLIFVLAMATGAYLIQ